MLQFFSWEEGLDLEIITRDFLGSVRRATCLQLTQKLGVDIAEAYAAALGIYLWFLFRCYFTTNLVLLASHILLLIISLILGSAVANEATHAMAHLSLMNPLQIIWMEGSLP